MATTGQTRAERQARRAIKKATLGRGTRRNRKKSRHELKKEQKNIRRAEWKSKIGTAANRKRKGVEARSIATRARGSHPLGHCGNIGCARCNPFLVQRVRQDPHSCDRRRAPIDLGERLG